MVSRYNSEGYHDPVVYEALTRGLTKRELDFIREEVEKRMSFDRIYFQAGSPGIAVNVGPGTFGLIYLRK